MHTYRHVEAVATVAKWDHTYVTVGEAYTTWAAGAHFTQPARLTLLCFPIYGPCKRLYSQVSLEQGCPDYRHLFHVATARFERKEVVTKYLSFLFISVYLRNYGLICLCYCIYICLILRAVSLFVKEPYFHHSENKFSLLPRRAFFFNYVRLGNFLMAQQLLASREVLSFIVWVSKC